MDVPFNRLLRVSSRDALAGESYSEFEVDLSGIRDLQRVTRVTLKNVNFFSSMENINENNNVMWVNYDAKHFTVPGSAFLTVTPGFPIEPIPSEAGSTMHTLGKHVCARLNSLEITGRYMYYSCVDTMGGNDGQIYFAGIGPAGVVRTVTISGTIATPAFTFDGLTVSLQPANFTGQLDFRSPTNESFAVAVGQYTYTTFIPAWISASNTIALRPYGAPLGGTGFQALQQDSVAGFSRYFLTPHVSLTTYSAYFFNDVQPGLLLRYMGSESRLNLAFPRTQFPLPMNLQGPYEGWVHISTFGRGISFLPELRVASVGVFPFKEFGTWTFYEWPEQMSTNSFEFVRDVDLTRFRVAIRDADGNAIRTTLPVQMLFGVTVRQ